MEVSTVTCLMITSAKSWRKQHLINAWWGCSSNDLQTRILYIFRLITPSYKVSWVLGRNIHFFQYDRIVYNCILIGESMVSFGDLNVSLLQQLNMNTLISCGGLASMIQHLQTKILEENSQTSKKQTNFAVVPRYLHSIYIILCIINNLEMIWSI